MNLGEIDIANIVGRVIIPNLSTGPGDKLDCSMDCSEANTCIPVKTLNLYRLAILNCSSERDYVPQ
jgi:hypothetical protein